MAGALAAGRREELAVVVAGVVVAAGSVASTWGDLVVFPDRVMHRAFYVVVAGLVAGLTAVMYGAGRLGWSRVVRWAAVVLGLVGVAALSVSPLNGHIGLGLGPLYVWFVVIQVGLGMCGLWLAARALGWPVRVVRVGLVSLAVALVARFVPFFWVHWGWCIPPLFVVLAVWVFVWSPRRARPMGEPG